MSLASLEQTFAEALLAPTLPEHLAGTRQAVYRTLVRSNMDDVIESFLPRTEARLGRRFWEEVQLFYQNQGPQTHYLRDIPSEFVAWLLKRWPHDPSIPSYICDLARHEVVAMEVGSAPAEAEKDVGPLDLSAPAVFADALRLIRYEYVIHELPEELEDRSEPEKRSIHLLIYRDSEHDLHYLELSLTAAAILQRMLEPSTTVQEAIVQGAQATNIPVNDDLLMGTGKLLADLAEREVLLGGLPTKQSG
jgi:uncharacterized protein